MHAAGGSAAGRDEPLPDDTYAVALQATKLELEALAEKLKSCGTPHFCQMESDGGFAGQLMSIGIAPCDRLTVKRLVAHLGLVK